MREVIEQHSYRAAKQLLPRVFRESDPPITRYTYTW